MTAVRSHPVAALDEWLFAPETAGRRAGDAPAARRRSSAFASPPVRYRGLAGAAGRPVPAGVVPAAGWTRCRRSGCSSPSRWSACWARSLAVHRVAGARHLPGGVVEPAGARRAAARAAGRSSTTTSSLLLVAGVLAAAPVGLRLLDQRRVAGVGVAGAHEPARRHRRLLPDRVPEGGVERSGVGAERQPAQRDVRAPASAAHAPTDEVSLFIADRPALAHLVALVTIVIELGAVVALVRPRLRPAYVVAAAMLHAGIYLTHGLDYSMWVATTAVVLIDWDAVAASSPCRAARCTRRSLTPSRHPPTTSSTTRSRTPPRSPGGCSTTRSWWPRPRRRPDEAPRRPAARWPSFLALVDDAASRIIDHPIRPRIKASPQGLLRGELDLVQVEVPGGAGGRARARPRRGPGRSTCGSSRACRPASRPAPVGLRAYVSQENVDRWTRTARLPDAARAHRGGRAAHHRRAAASA